MSIATLVSESKARHLSRRMPDHDLVAWANELAQAMALHNLDDQQVKSQISRASEAAAHSPAILLFNSWVRYQNARDASRLWKSKTKLDGQEMTVADALLKLVNRIRTRLKEAAGTEGIDDTALVERATMHATARLLSFFRRSVVVEIDGRKPS